MEYLEGEEKNNTKNYLRPGKRATRCLSGSSNSGIWCRLHLPAQARNLEKPEAQDAWQHPGDWPTIILTTLTIQTD